MSRDTSWSASTRSVSSRASGSPIACAPIQKPSRIEAHVFIAFLSYCLSITLRQQLRGLAGGLMPPTVLEKLASVQMLDVRIPTTDGREILLMRHTEPSRDVNLLLDALKLQLPPQPPPRISQKQQGL